MKQELKAGSAYFGIVFAVGFVLGTIRVLVLVPQFGELTSGLIEMPIILMASWIICSWLIIRFSVPRVWQSRLNMGIAAFVLLMVAELFLSILLFDNSINDHFNHYLKLNGSLGLAGQIAFAAFPIIQIYTSDVKERV
ncbi:MAG: hypothetical protein DHS20C13_05340 [Thermodesulfobacteriota bacterium]|nr:MAG: hypothetical protein DHS20C13_05340 [Thermodesulfobacteriota bacterium]